MKHVWADAPKRHGQVISFRHLSGPKETKLLLSAGPFYSVFFDGEFVSYGPERTAAGHSRLPPSGVSSHLAIALSNAFKAGPVPWA